MSFLHLVLSFSVKPRKGKGKEKVDVDEISTCFICQHTNTNLKLSCGHFVHDDCLQMQLSHLSNNGAMLLKAYAQCFCTAWISSKNLRIRNDHGKYEKFKLKMVTSKKLKQFQDYVVRTLPRYPTASFFRCYICNELYSLRESGPCDAKAIPESSEIRCSKCKDLCVLHGEKFLLHKCQFCCDFATFKCFGYTYTCGICQIEYFGHGFQAPKRTIPKPCICKRHHPVNGITHCYGCVICNDMEPIMNEI
jgi:hypothetical protein